MAETMKDYEKELNESMKKIEEGDILTGTVVSVDEKEVKWCCKIMRKNIEIKQIKPCIIFL